MTQRTPNQATCLPRDGREDLGKVPRSLARSTYACFEHLPVFPEDRPGTWSHATGGERQVLTPSTISVGLPSDVVVGIFELHGRQLHGRRCGYYG